MNQPSSAPNQTQVHAHPNLKDDEDEDDRTLTKLDDFQMHALYFYDLCHFIERFARHLETDGHKTSK